MSIFIIRGPEASGALIRTAVPLPAPVLKSLVHRAIDAGTSVAIRACGSEQELLDALRVADHSRGEVTLLDPGACANSLRLQHGPAAVVVDQRSQQAGYPLSLAIVGRRLAQEG